VLLLGRVARRAWGSVSELSNNVLRRVSTYTQDTQAAAQQGADKIRVQVDEVKETRRHPKEQVD
jgi:predicted membrane chloride channel (bestrophin family)